jgi:hypothetical protein
MVYYQQGIRVYTKGGELTFDSAEISQRNRQTARGITLTKGSTLCHEYGHLRLSNAREIKHKAASHATSSNTGSVTVSNANHDGNNGSDGDGGDEGGGEDGGDDDPSDVALSPPIVYHLVIPNHFLSCLLLAGTAWLFKDSFLAAIPLIGLCALCAFPETLQFLRGEVSSQGAKFEIRSKK